MLTDAEGGEVLKNIALWNQPNGHLSKVAIKGGMRIEELLVLRVKDIMLDLAVRQSECIKKGGYIIQNEVIVCSEALNLIIPC